MDVFREKIAPPDECWVRPRKAPYGSTHKRDRARLLRGGRGGSDRRFKWNLSVTSSWLPPHAIKIYIEEPE